MSVHDALSKGVIDQPFSCIVAADEALRRKHDVYVINAKPYKPQIVFEFNGTKDVHLADGCENPLVVVDGVLLLVFTDREQAKVQWINWSKRRWSPNGYNGKDLLAPAIQVNLMYSQGRHNSMYTLVHRGTFETWPYGPATLTHYWSSTSSIHAREYDRNTSQALTYTSTGEVEQYGPGTAPSSQDKTLIHEALRLLRDAGWSRL